MRNNPNIVVLIAQILQVFQQITYRSLPAAEMVLTDVRGNRLHINLQWLVLEEEEELHLRAYHHDYPQGQILEAPLQALPLLVLRPQATVY